MPPQTKFIVGNEACERFSYYGVVSILTVYTAKLYGGTPEAEVAAKETVHWFKGLCYLTPLIGAWIADRFWGRYNTILWLSLAYCVGHALLAVGEGTLWGLFAGLAFITIGSGGIKPSVSAFAGDQFTGGREHLVSRIYNWFYWSINFGAFFAFQYIPQIAQTSYSWAFGLPGIAMGLATIIFWAGRRQYIRIPPRSQSEVTDPALKAAGRKRLWWIVAMFVPVIFFWSLFDQQHTTWVQQGKRMVPFEVLGLKFDGETMQSVNAILIMLFVPLFALVIYPLLRRMGFRLTALGRMGAGFFLAGASFVAAAVVQSWLDRGEVPSVGWQFMQYALMTAGEVLISTTGLEFAFTQAPAHLKSTIMSFWLLTVFFGNIFAALVTRVNAAYFQITQHTELLFYAVVVVVAGIAFAMLAKRFPEITPAQTAPAP